MNRDEIRQRMDEIMSRMIDAVDNSDLKAIPELKAEYKQLEDLYWKGVPLANQLEEITQNLRAHDPKSANELEPIYIHHAITDSDDVRATLFKLVQTCNINNVKQVVSEKFPQHTEMLDKLLILK